MDNLYFDYAKFQKELLSLKVKYPGIKLIPAAKSRMGRDIFALTAGNPLHANFIIGGFEGDGILSVKTVTALARRYFDALFSEKVLCEINIKKAAEERTAVFIPCLNPDGAEIFSAGTAAGLPWLQKSAAFFGRQTESYRANAGGVELEGNFDHDFADRTQKERLSGKFTKSPFGFSGQKAFSEPETAGLRNFLTSFEPNLICRLSGGKGEILWRSDSPHKNSKRIAKVLSSLSGYAMEAEISDSSAGTFRKWASAALKAPCIDIKLPQISSVHTADKIFAELMETLAVAAVI